jgi:hypothetical protein
MIFLFELVKIHCPLRVERLLGTATQVTGN